MNNKTISSSSDLFIDKEETEPDELQKIEINLLLDGLYQKYGYDFRGYVRSSVSRRILHRMRAERLSTITALLEQVLHKQDYLERLLDDLSIQMTEMYRDPSFFAAFRRLTEDLLVSEVENRFYVCLRVYDMRNQRIYRKV